MYFAVSVQCNISTIDDKLTSMTSYVAGCVRIGFTWSFTQLPVLSPTQWSTAAVSTVVSSRGRGRRKVHPTYYSAKKRNNSAIKQISKKGRQSTSYSMTGMSCSAQSHGRTNTARIDSRSHG